MASSKQSIVCVCILTVISIGLLRPANAQWVVDDEGCRTPNRGVGSCISVKECRPMIEFIQNNRDSLSTNVRQILSSYQCGFEGKVVKVCCPDGPIFTGRQPVNNGIPPPPDVSSHRNLGTIPYECGLSSASYRITGGNKTALLEYPWMALLAYETGKGVSFRCGGTVINDRYILTAAHCIARLTNLKLVSVRLGEHDIGTDKDCDKNEFGDEFCSDPVQDITVEESIPHPNYNPTTITDDIGLIRLSSKINLLTDSVKPICLPTTPESRAIPNSKLTVTGWGATETERRSNILLYVNVPVVKEDACRNAYANTQVKIGYKQMCAGGQNGMDSCGGDSGGPLQTAINHNEDFRYIQYGIVSFGPKFCGREGYPGVYTRVAYYMDWILDAIRP